MNSLKNADDYSIKSNALKRAVKEKGDKLKSLKIKKKKELSKRKKLFRLFGCAYVLGM